MITALLILIAIVIVCAVVDRFDRGPDAPNPSRMRAPPGYGEGEP